MLVEWCTRNIFVITNTWFQHHMKDLYTWKSPGNTCRNQMNYIPITEHFQSTMTRMRIYSGADCGSDCSLLMGKVRIDLKKLKCSKVKLRVKWKVLIGDEDVKTKFCLKDEE